MTEPTQTTQVTWPDPADRVQPGRTEPLARQAPALAQVIPPRRKPRIGGRRVGQRIQAGGKVAAVEGEQHDVRLEAV